MAVLLDVNVLVALAWPNHVHHAAAVHWFLETGQYSWATTPATETGFVRVSSNRAIIPEAKRAAEAIVLLRQLTERDGHVFWVDDIPFTRSELVAAERIIGHRQVTEAHLVALALRHRGRLATFDGGMAAILPAGVGADELFIRLG